MKKYIYLLFAIVILTEVNAVSQAADKFLIKAAMLAESKQYDQALESINQTTSTDNKNYNKVLAEIHYGLRDYDKSIELFNKLEETTPGTYQLELSQCYAMKGNMPKAMDHLTEYFKQKNKLPLSKIINDKAFTQFRNNKSWEDLWQKINYSEPEVKVNLVNAASENGFNEYFNSVLDEALKKYPNNAELLYNQSKYYLNENMLDAAQNAINQALNQKSGADKYYYLKAEILKKGTRNKEALTNINEAIKRNPFDVKYYLTRIDINRMLGNSNAANEDLVFLNFCLPDNPEVKLAQIQNNTDKGNYLTAYNDLTALIEKEKPNKDYYILRGQMGLKVLKLQSADEDFGMALDLSPSNAEANLGRGIAKYKLDDLSAACYYWQKAINEGNREALDYLNKYCRN